MRTVDRRALAPVVKHRRKSVTSFLIQWRIKGKNPQTGKVFPWKTVGERVCPKEAFQLWTSLATEHSGRDFQTIFKKKKITLDELNLKIAEAVREERKADDPG